MRENRPKNTKLPAIWFYKAELGPLQITHGLPFTRTGSYSGVPQWPEEITFRFCVVQLSSPWNYWMYLYIRYCASSFVSSVFLTSNQRIKTETLPSGFTAGKIPQNIVLLVPSNSSSCTETTQYFSGTFSIKSNSLLSTESLCLHSTFVPIFILTGLWFPHDFPQDRHF